MPIKQVGQTGSKKQELLARKAKILSDLKYYEKRLKDDLASNASDIATPGAFDDSSDSEGDILPFHIEDGPSISQLQAAEKMLRTVVNATQELACLEVIEAEVQVMVTPPEIQGETPVTKPGTWKDVAAECRIDLVPFSITFYVHQADGMFGAKSYRSLNILAVKKSQEAEISKSVLSRVTCPSNALEVIRNYSVAYRSRRTTLARLADKYAHTLFMEPMPDGGYRLKCSNLLELSWTLVNKKSPLAPFHHSMSFDLEYIEESYLKIIKQAHKQLSDPSIDTDERTLLLAKIINTCLEAEGPMQESMESETESVKKVEKRRITIEAEASEPKKTKNTTKNDDIQKNKTIDKNVDDNVVGDQIMAPPKTVPKKTKPKGKENIDHSKKAVKRSTVDENRGSLKKARTDKSNVNDLNEIENENNRAVNDKVKNDEKTNNAGNKNSKNHHANDLKSSENAKNKAVIEKSKNDENTTKDKGKDKVKNQNLVTKVSKNQNIDKVESKIKKAEVKLVTKNVNTEIKNDNVTQKKNKESEAQEKSKKIIDKDTETQKVVSEETKNSESHKVASKVKESGLTNDLNAKISKKSEKGKDASKEKKGSPKNDQESAQDNDEPGKKNVLTQKVVSKSKVSDSTNTANAKVSVKNKEAGKEKKDIPQDDRQPIKNNVENKKKTSKINDLQKASKENQKKLNKALERNNTNEKKEIKQESNAKNSNKTENVVNKNAKNDNKTKVIPTKSNEAEKKSHTKNIEDKTKPKNIESKNDKNAQKSNTDPRIQQKDTNPTKREKTLEKKLKTNKDANKPKFTEQNKNAETFDKDKIITSTPILKNINKDEQRNCKEIVEKVSKTSNIATKTKEHIANITISKNTIPKDKSGKIIKNLSHKNPSQNKLSKNFTSKMSVKTGINDKVLKTSNLSKESDGSKVSRIPKKLPAHENLRKNPLRISPRKMPSTFKSASDPNVRPKLNYITNIPRLKKTELKGK